MAQAGDILLTRNAAGMHTFTWTVGNFTKLTENLSSPFFCTETSNLTMRWFATLKFSRKGVDVWLTRVVDTTDKVKLQITTIIVDSYGHEKKNAFTNSIYTKENSSHCCCSLRFVSLPSDIPVAEALGNILAFSSDSLTIQFNMSIGLKDSTATMDDLMELSDCFFSIFENKNGADITLRVGDKNIRAHKLVLSCRSPVFAERLKTIEHEGLESVLEITDLSYECLFALVMHLYSGTVKHYDSSLDEELYKAAIAYSVETLQNSCADYIINTLSKENVCHILSLAEKQKDSLLFEAAKTYICDNFAEVGKTTKWNALVAENPRLCSNVLATLFKRVEEC